MTRFEQLLEQINREHVYIQTHNFPDPDAIASAYGLQRLLETRGIRAMICYKGKIDRYSTDKLREILGIELHNVENLGAILSDEDEVILVDSQKGNSNIIDITGDEIICIDHHPYNDKSSYRFMDIRPQNGACATMIAEYFVENDVPMDEKIATALTYGIRIDTNNLTRGVSKLDIEMICSTHGPVWTRDIAKVIGIYDRLSRYQAEPGVVIAYGSMYGNTEQMAERIARTLAACGVSRIRLHNLSSADMSAVLRDIFDYDTLIVGSPTYNGELFPEVESLLSKIVARGIPQRRFAAFGSFCWAGAAVKRIVDTAERLGWTVLCPTVEMKQGYSHSVEQQCDELARSVAADMQ